MASVIILRPPPTSTLFPYTTLFRSRRAPRRAPRRSVRHPPRRTSSTRSDEPDRLRARRPRTRDRKSTRLNSSHLGISYAVFCLKKKTFSAYVQSEPDDLEEPASHRP